MAARPALANGADDPAAAVNQVSFVSSPAEAEAYLAGDFNLNHALDAGDVTACAMAWRDRPTYFKEYPLADVKTLNAVGDFTGDGLFDGRDIEPYKTYIVAALVAQQEQQEQPDNALNSVVWVNDALSEASIEAEPSTEGVADPVDEPVFTYTSPTRTSTGTGSQAKVFTASGNSGGGGGGGSGGASVMSGGGGGGGSANVISGGTASGDSQSLTDSKTVTNQNSGGGTVSVVGGGSTTVVADGEPSTGQTDSAVNTVLTGGQDNTELRNPNAAVAPIEHEPNYRGEADLFGYVPRYEPNPVAFDLDNKPYIRVAGNVQTRGANGNWISLPLADSVTRYYQNKRINLTFDIMGGQFIDQRITFDSRGDAYTIAVVVSGSNWWWFLLHSRDNCVTWDVYPMPGVGHARIEINDGHNTLTHPPAVLRFKDQHLGLILPTRKSDGTLDLPREITVTEESMLGANHSGGANSVITVGEQVFVVYPLSKPYQLSKGTSQFVTAFDRATGRVTTPRTLLGSVGDEGPDGHFIPAITADSRGYLHVVLGAHHDDLFYLKSRSPGDASSWSAPVAIGKPVLPGGAGHTYPSLLCDANDQLHIVTRWAGEKDYHFRLVYIAGDALTGEWRPQEVLVSPFRSFYSIWYHHLSMDRLGRLFLNYRYYGNQLTAEQIAAYRLKWPEDGVPANSRPYPQQQTITQIKSHDPAMLFSGDGGDAWKLATSPDLFAGNP